ncbi:MAG TPA: hemerythrin domain-containing protein [Nitrospiraceae bacterium]|jgi:hemerythrin superfamily protein|nr:hemerythrin domain-containing protein [Nitrospiraceae bacterium]
MFKEMFDKATGSDSVVSMLKDDHKKVQTLFKEFEEAEDRRTKTQVAQKALQELEVHAALEEEIIYPAFRTEIEEEEVMMEALEEHHVAHFLIGELKRMGPGDERFDAKFKVLAESVKHHIKEEESKVLPEAEESDTPELLEQVMERKEQLLRGTARPKRRGAVQAKTRSHTRGKTGSRGKRRAVA